MKFPAKAILIRDVVDRFLIKVIQIRKNTAIDFFQKQESTKFNCVTLRGILCMWHATTIILSFNELYDHDNFLDIFSEPNG